MTGSAVTFYSSTPGAGTTLAVGNCGGTFSIFGTTNLGDSVTIKVAVNGAVAAQAGTTASGDWSIASVTAGTDDIIVVWADNVADSSETTAVAKYDGTGDMTGMVLNTNVLSIGSVDDEVLDISDDLVLYDCTDDEDVMYRVAVTTLEVEGGGGA